MINGCQLDRLLPCVMLSVPRWHCLYCLQELAGRMAADETLYRRRPKNLVVHYR
jgi:hypothetical protein